MKNYPVGTDLKANQTQILPLLGVYNMGLDVRKSVFGGLQTTQAQTRLPISAV